MQDIISNFWQGIEKHHYIPLFTMSFSIALVLTIILRDKRKSRKSGR